MILGLKDNEVMIVPYDLKWKTEFEEVKSEIMSQTGLHSDRIEHIGSTAIKGIKAKPIIDILIGLDDLQDIETFFFEQLKGVGFYRLRVQKEDEIICAKFTDDTFKMKTHIIHIVEFKQEKWEQLTSFRDFLNNNLTERKQYEALKEKFLESGQAGIENYTNNKELFVQEILDRMLEGKKTL